VALFAPYRLRMAGAVGEDLVAWRGHILVVEDEFLVRIDLVAVRDEVRGQHLAKVFDKVGFDGNLGGSHGPKIAASLPAGTRRRDPPILGVRHVARLFTQRRSSR